MPAQELEAERRRIIEYQYSQLIGPSAGPNETLPEKDPACKHYIMGTLYPVDMSMAPVLQEEDEGAEPDVETEQGSDSPVSLAFQMLPASVGISFFVKGSGRIVCSVHGSRYALIKDEEGARKKVWKRMPIAESDRPEDVDVKPPRRDGGEYRSDVLEGHASLHVIWRPMGAGYLITVTLVNGHPASGNIRQNFSNCLHQVGISCRALNGGVEKYPGIGTLSWDEEEEELALLYRQRSTFAIGHGCAADWDLSREGKVLAVRTEFLPSVEVRGITTELVQDGTGRRPREFEDLLRLQYLAGENLTDKGLERRLNAFVDLYNRWIKRTESENSNVPVELRSARKRLLERMRVAESRMRRGINCLIKDRFVRRAFTLANRAMLIQMIHSGAEYGGGQRARKEKAFTQPDYRSSEYAGLKWRPFQLAFVLLAIESVVNERSGDRDAVDLIWFPTGGGKTEAYLMLAAVEIFHRRLRYGAEGGGTAVIKRYTLRLLTAQQFQRAAALVCACELIRREHEPDLGTEPITLGLWVGGEVSPNRFTGTETGAVELRQRMLEEDKPENPFQLQRCPWCGTRIVPARRVEDQGSYGIRATATSFSFFCPTETCKFHDSLPVSVVDEDLYNRPPTFLIGTIDKFARMAWDSRSRFLFGKREEGKVRPPSLIIQDELHLISGPLGTVAGIYEAAIDTVIWEAGVRPKILGATATIRRAREQARRLYGRDVLLFPPSGLSADDSFYARTDTSSPGRLYVGVMGQGHTPLYSLVLASAALTQAPVELDLQGIARDGYWTLVMFHNSRRELGKTMTAAMDDLPARVKVIARDQSRIRHVDSVVELSANVPGKDIPEVLDRMQIEAGSQGAIDILPCTNMLSVGVDVKRLGLMLVNGQPKTTAEYIQASSRVGRDVVPGLVISLYSGTKPRDRSHYEGFRPYHEAFYRFVEPTSVTPYALPARERALHAALVILARHAGGLPEDDDAANFDPTRNPMRQLIEKLKGRIKAADPEESGNAIGHLERIIEYWVQMVRKSASTGPPLRYDSVSGRQFASLLCTYEDQTDGAWPTLNSMRNVDPECRIHVLGEPLQ